MRPKNIYIPLCFLSTLFIFVSCGGGGTTNNTPTENIPNTTTATTTPPSTTIAPVTTSPIIDVLVLYDKKVQDSYSNVTTRVNHLFAVSNNIYRDSQLEVKINAIKILLYDVQNFPALDEISRSSEVRALRKQYNADTVLLYQINPDGEYGLCGVAYSAGAYEEKYQYIEAMYSNVAINCPSDSTAHELGHNMGLGHSHKQDGDALRPYSYGLGHGIEGKFTTMMAYPFVYGTDTLITKFSSPEYECIPGYPCGIPVGQVGEAHATRVIQITAPKISEIYP